MIRLIDKLLADEKWPMHGLCSGCDERAWKIICDDYYKRLIKARVFVIDNVTQYLFAQCNQEIWGPEDFPHLAPPFESMWIETYAPSHCQSEGVSKPWTGYSSWGWLMESKEIPSVPDDIKAPLIKGEFYPPEGDPRWSTTATLFCSLHGRITGPSLVQTYVVMPDGRPFNGKMIMGIVGRDPRHGIGEQSVVNQPEIFPVKLAISLMHCKNVAHETVSPSEQATRAYKKKIGKEPVSYHVLKIEPFKSAMRSAGSEKTGLKQAMHICRGHFKDYTKSGLFGKLQGVYWWHSAVRGKNSERRIIKDYEVSPEFH